MNTIFRAGLLVLTLIVSCVSSAVVHADTCPDKHYINVTAGSVPDFIHPMPATPGAFGGKVACVLAKSPRGVEQYMAEFLPRQETFSVLVIYKQNYIKMQYTFLPENRRVSLVECSRKTTELANCVVDLSGGQGLYLVRSFGPNGAIKQVRVIAKPDQGMIKKLVLPYFLETKPEHRQVTLEIVEAEQKYTMVPQGSKGLYAVASQDISNLGNLLFKNPYTLKLAYALQRNVGEQRQNIASDWTVDKSTFNFVMQQLFRMETLMTKGKEGTVDLRF